MRAEIEIVGLLLASLPAAERARRYRDIACDAFERAASAQDETTRAGYLSLASGWQVLALQVEHSIGLERALPGTECRAESGFATGL